MMTNSKALLKGAALVGALCVATITTAIGQTWTWQGTCGSNNEWHATCWATDTTCSGNTRYFNNWGSTARNSSSLLTFPGPGSIVLLGNNSVKLPSGTVDVKQITVGGTFEWIGGTIILRDPANNNAPGTLYNQANLLLQGSSHAYWSGVLQNNGTMVLNKPSSNLLAAADNAQIVNTGTFEHQAGSLITGYGGVQLINQGTIRKTTNSNVTWNRIHFTHQSGTGLVLAEGTLTVSSGSFTVPSGATLNLSLQGGSLVFSSATLTVQGTLRGTGTSGSATFNSSTASGGGTLNFPVNNPLLWVALGAT